MLGPAGAGTRRERNTMSESMAYRQIGDKYHNQAHTLFAQTMGYVAGTAALFAPLGGLPWAGA